jgi:hypothetical protein
MCVHVTSLDRQILWFAVERAADAGRACRDYVVFDEDGTALLQARAHPWRRDIVLRSALDPARAHLTIRRRVTFPLSGRLDVYDDGASRIGVLSRNGSYRDARGRRVGRFRDARTFRDHAREGIAMAVLDALLSGDGTTAIGSGPSGFVWLAGDSAIGTLARAALPFPHGAASEAAIERPPANMLGRIARRLRTLRRSQPSGWKLERFATAPTTDARLTAAAALFAVELSHW